MLHISLLVCQGTDICPEPGFDATHRVSPVVMVALRGLRGMYYMYGAAMEQIYGSRQVVQDLHAHIMRRTETRRQLPPACCQLLSEYAGLCDAPTDMNLRCVPSGVPALRGRSAVSSLVYLRDCIP